MESSTSRPGNAAASSRSWRLKLWVLFAFLTGLFFTTAPKSSWSADPLLNSITAWNLGTKGSFILDSHAELVEPEYFLEVTWVMPGTSGPVSLFPPGAAMVASPLYALGWGQTEVATKRLPSGNDVSYLVPPIAPGALVASLSTAATATLLAVLFSRLATERAALVGAVVFALGTGAWSVASQALWQHGPAMMWIAMGLLYPKPTLTGLAWLPAVLTRPHVAAIPLLESGYEAITTRQWRRVVLPGAATAAGALLFLTYNRLLFGSWSPFAAYASNPVLTVQDLDLSGLIANLAGALLDSRRGLLIISPFLVVLIPGLRQAWRAAPRWVKGAALGGLIFWLIQYKLHDFRGGDRFFGYRFALEGLLATAPLLFLSYHVWVIDTPPRMWLFRLAVAFAVILQVIGVLNPLKF